MKILLWTIQILLAIFFTLGAANQLFNYDRIAEQYIVYRSVPQLFWIVYASIALLCTLGLVMTKVWPLGTAIAALVLAVQGTLFAGLYAYHAGFEPSFVLWAFWTLTPVVLASFVAWARFPKPDRTPSPIRARGG